MSDIFSQSEERYRRTMDRQAQESSGQSNGSTNDYRALRDTQHLARTEDIRQRTERAQNLREQYGYDFTVGQYAALASAMDNGIIGEDQAHDLLAAQTISDNLKRLGIN